MLNKAKCRRSSQSVENTQVKRGSMQVKVPGSILFPPCLPGLPTHPCRFHYSGTVQSDVLLVKAANPNRFPAFVKHPSLQLVKIRLQTLLKTLPVFDTQLAESRSRNAFTVRDLPAATLAACRTQVFALCARSTRSTCWVSWSGPD